MKPETTANKKLCIVAGDYNQAVEFAREHRLDPNDWWYPLDRRRMLGMRNYNFIRVGNFYARHCAYEIETELEIADAREVKDVKI